MNKKLAIGVLVGIGLLALFSLSTAPVSLLDLLSEPIASLWGSSQQLQSGVLEVSGNIEPVQEATRRLFKPLGGVYLIRRYSEPTQKTDPHNP